MLLAIIIIGHFGKKKLYYRILHFLDTYADFVISYLIFRLQYAWFCTYKMKKSTMENASG